MAAHLDFPLVSWLRRERSRAARVDDFVASLKQIHREFSWPYPSVPTSHIRRYSGMSNEMWKGCTRHKNWNVKIGRKLDFLEHYVSYNFICYCVASLQSHLCDLEGVLMRDLFWWRRRCKDSQYQCQRWVWENGCA